MTFLLLLSLVYMTSHFLFFIYLNFKEVKMIKKDYYGEVFLGSILLLAGLFMIFANFFKLSIFGILFLPLLGLLFFVWSIFSKEFKLIIPAGIIEGLGLGIVFTSLLTVSSESIKGGFFFIGFSIGWFLITILCKLIFKKNVLWPLIPGFLLLIFGFLITIEDKGLNILLSFNIFWPFILVLAGLILIFNFLKGKN